MTAIPLEQILTFPSVLLGRLGLLASIVTIIEARLLQSVPLSDDFGRAKRCTIAPEAHSTLPSVSRWLNGH